MRGSHKIATAGFTLIEIIMVIVVLSIFAAVVMTRYHDDTGTTVSVEADHLARDIRHMQMLAMTWGQTLRLNFPNATSYRVVCVSGSITPPCNGGGAVTDSADAAPLTRTLLNSVAMSGATPDLEMDSLGRPVSGGVLLNADRSYTLAGGTETSSVSVSRLTGFVNVVH